MSGIIKSIFPLSVWESLPILEVGEKCGDTGYIDFIRKEEIKFPIMGGIDDGHRPFFVMEVVSDDEDKIHYAQTFFQRWTDNQDKWVSGDIVGRTIFMSTSPTMNNKHIDVLKKLINGESIVFPEELAAWENKRPLRLCTQKEINN